MALAPDIAERIEKDFSADDARAVKGLLVELQRDEAQVFGDRLLRCLLYVAHGSVDALGNAVALARTDCRDLIVAAEYGGDWKQVRDFTKPFGSAV